MRYSRLRWMYELMFKMATTAAIRIISSIPPTMNTHLRIASMSFLRSVITSGGINCNRPATADDKPDYTSMHKYYSVTQKCVDETCHYVGWMQCHSKL